MAALRGEGRSAWWRSIPEDAHEVLGANTIAEMMDAGRGDARGEGARLMADGVTIFRPETW